MNGHAGMKYTVPGGGWGEHEEHYSTARREAEEEAHLKVKNIFYANNYIELNNGRKDESLQFVSDHYKWVGYYTEVFVGEYYGHYHGYVDEQYKDRRISQG